MADTLHLERMRRENAAEERSPEMRLHTLVVGLGLILTSIGCSDDSGDPEGASPSGGTLSAPMNLKATTVDGKPHLTWVDGQNEEHYMIERMDHAASSEWVMVKGADNLVINSTQFHDGSASAGGKYMYRVVGMKGQARALSNEVTWP